MGVEGIEQFVATPEAHSDQAIESDPLPPGQVWTISPGGNGLAPSFRESVRYGEQNLLFEGGGIHFVIIVQVSWRKNTNCYIIISKMD